MKKVFLGLLGLSLAGNIGLLLLPPRSTASDASPIRVAPPAASALPISSGQAPTSGIATSAGVKPMVWRRGTSDDDLRALAAGLRAAGFPSRAIYAAINEAFSEKLAAEDPTLRSPHWERSSSDYRQAALGHLRDGKTRLDAILGPDARLSAQIDPRTRTRKYGELSDEKIDSLKQIERDYEELQTDINASYGNSITGEQFALIQQQRELLKKETSLDLAAALTPEELQAYELRNSDVSRLLSVVVRDMPIDEEEFAAISHLRKAFEESNPRLTGVTTPEQRNERQTKQQLLNEQTRAVLGDERFYQYLNGTDGLYRELTTLAAQHPRLTPSASYQVSQLRAEAEIKLTALNRSRQSNRSELDSAYADFNARLEALVGSDAAAAIKTRNSYRIFVPPASRAKALPATGK